MTHLVGAGPSWRGGHGREGHVGYGKDVRLLGRAVAHVGIRQALLFYVQARDILKGVDGHENFT